MTVYMDYTDLGMDFLSEAVSDGLQYEITHVAYGTDGYDHQDPNLPLVLISAATALGAEVYRHTVASITQDVFTPTTLRQTVYTSVSREDFSDFVGEAGLIATVLVAGTSGRAVGDQVLFMHAHFPRIPIPLEKARLAIRWPMEIPLT